MTDCLPFSLVRQRFAGGPRYLLQLQSAAAITDERAVLTAHPTQGKQHKHELRRGETYDSTLPPIPVSVAADAEARKVRLGEDGAAAVMSDLIHTATHKKKQPVVYTAASVSPVGLYGATTGLGERERVVVAAVTNTGHVGAFTMHSTHAATWNWRCIWTMSDNAVAGEEAEDVCCYGVAWSGLLGGSYACLFVAERTCIHVWKVQQSTTTDADPTFTYVCLCNLALEKNEAVSTITVLEGATGEIPPLLIGTSAGRLLCCSIDTSKPATCCSTVAIACGYGAPVSSCVSCVDASNQTTIVWVSGSDLYVYTEKNTTTSNHTHIPTDDSTSSGMAVSELAGGMATSEPITEHSDVVLVASLAAEPLVLHRQFKRAPRLHGPHNNSSVVVKLSNVHSASISALDVCGGMIATGGMDGNVILFSLQAITRHEKSAALPEGAASVVGKVIWSKHFAAKTMECRESFALPAGIAFVSDASHLIVHTIVESGHFTVKQSDRYQHSLRVVPLYDFFPVESLLDGYARDLAAVSGGSDVTHAQPPFLDGMVEQLKANLLTIARHGTDSFALQSAATLAGAALFTTGSVGLSNFKHWLKQLSGRVLATCAIPGKRRLLTLLPQLEAGSSVAALRGLVQRGVPAYWESLAACFPSRKCANSFARVFQMIRNNDATVEIDDVQHHNQWESFFCALPAVCETLLAEYFRWAGDPSAHQHGYGWRVLMLLCQIMHGCLSRGVRESADASTQHTTTPSSPSTVRLGTFALPLVDGAADLPPPWVWLCVVGGPFVALLAFVEHRLLLGEAGAIDVQLVHALQHFQRTGYTLPPRMQEYIHHHVSAGDHEEPWKQETCALCGQQLVEAGMWQHSHAEYTPHTEFWLVSNTLCGLPSHQSIAAALERLSYPVLPASSVCVEGHNIHRCGFSLQLLATTNTRVTLGPTGNPVITSNT